MSISLFAVGIGRWSLAFLGRWWLRFTVCAVCLGGLVIRIVLPLVTIIAFAMGCLCDLFLRGGEAQELVNGVCLVCRDSGKAGAVWMVVVGGPRRQGLAWSCGPQVGIHP